MTRPWRAKPEGSLRLWRRAWGLCASASSALGLHGGAWLKAATVIPGDSLNAAVTLDIHSARAVVQDAATGAVLTHGPNSRRIRICNPLWPSWGRVVAILLVSGKDAWFDVNNNIEGDLCVTQLHLLLLLEDSMFAVALANSPGLKLAASPLPLCDAVCPDGFDAGLLVPHTVADHRWPNRSRVDLPLNDLFSTMRRVARDGLAYDLFDFAVWYDHCGGVRRWLEAPPVAEVQDEREIALDGMLTRAAPPPPPRPSPAAGGAASGAPGAASGAPATPHGVRSSSSRSRSPPRTTLQHLENSITSVQLAIDAAVQTMSMQGFGHQLVSMFQSAPRPPWLQNRPLLLPDGALVDEEGVTLFNSLRAVQAQLDHTKLVIGDAKTAVRDAKELITAFNLKYPSSMRRRESDVGPDRAAEAAPPEQAAAAA